MCPLSNSAWVWTGIERCPEDVSGMLWVVSFSRRAENTGTSVSYLCTSGLVAIVRRKLTSRWYLLRFLGTAKEIIHVSEAFDIELFRFPRIAISVSLLSPLPHEPDPRKPWTFLENKQMSALLLHENDKNGRAVGKSMKKFHRGVPHQNLANNNEICDLCLLLKALYYLH